MIIYIADPKRQKYARISVSAQHARRLDNGSLISTGLWVPDDIGKTHFDRLVKNYGRLVTKEQFNHSGCQSSCILRGDSKCQW